MTQMRRWLAMIAFVVFGIGCPAAMQFLQAAASGASYLGDVLAEADAGAHRYFARHPNESAQSEVEAAMRDAMAAAVVLRHAAGTAQSVDDGDLAEARAEAIKAWGILRDLLDRHNVLSGEPPDGGAENTDAPLPGPLVLPTLDEISRRTAYR